MKCQTSTKKTRNMSVELWISDFRTVGGTVWHAIARGKSFRTNMAPGTTRSTSRKTKINSKKRKLDDIEGEEVSKTALANIQEESNKVKVGLNIEYYVTPLVEIPFNISANHLIHLISTWFCFELNAPRNSVFFYLTPGSQSR